MKSASRYTGPAGIAVLIAIASLLVPNGAAFAASKHSGARRLETTEHRYYDSADRLHIDIRIQHIPLRLRDDTPGPAARGGGRRSHSRAHEQSIETQVAAPVADPDAVQPEGEMQTSGAAPSGFFTAPGYGPPLPSAAHPMLPMPLAP